MVSTLGSANAARSASWEFVPFKARWLRMKSIAEDFVGVFAATSLRFQLFTSSL